MLDEENKRLRARARELESEREILRRARGRDGLVSRLQSVEDHRATSQVKRLCRVVKVSRSGYYRWRAAVEAFNTILKRETLQGRKRWPGPQEARIAMFR